MQFCPACDGEYIDDARAFGYDGPLFPNRKGDPADDEPVLCERHANEYPTVCLCGAPVQRPGDFTCGDPNCVVASDAPDEPAATTSCCGAPVRRSHDDGGADEGLCDVCSTDLCSKCAAEWDSDGGYGEDGQSVHIHALCRYCKNGCPYCGKPGHNGGCRAQERHDRRCL